MSHLFVTSDTHFNHKNIIKYCSRPFKNLHEMNKIIISNWNERIKENDTILFLGDFCFKVNKEKYLIWKNQLNGNIVFIKGNHDKNNSLKTYINSLIIEYGNYKILCQHRPPEEIPDYINFALCGHVHEKWKSKAKPPTINVSVDMWNFRPIRMDEILKYYKGGKFAESDSS